MPAFKHILDQFVDLRAIPDVKFIWENSLSGERCVYFVGRAVQDVCSTRGNDNFRVGGSEGLGKRATDSAATTRDDRNLFCQWFTLHHYANCSLRNRTCSRVPAAAQVRTLNELIPSRTRVLSKKQS